MVPAACRESGIQYSEQAKGLPTAKTPRTGDRTLWPLPAVRHNLLPSGGSHGRKRATPSNETMRSYHTTPSQYPGRHAVADDDVREAERTVVPQMNSNALRTCGRVRTYHIASLWPTPNQGRMPPPTDGGHASSPHVRESWRSIPVFSPSRYDQIRSRACVHSIWLRASANTQYPWS